MTKNFNDRVESLRPRTRMVHGGTKRSKFGETSEALYITSGYVYSTPEEAEARFKEEAEGFTYSRFGNPTVSVFEERMALMDGAEAAWATASGMAAVFASLMCQLKAGDRVVAARALFGSCRYILEEILPKFGIDVILVDGTDLNQWENALGSNTSCVLVESPSNPRLEILNLKKICDLSHNAGAQVIVDNVFATPILQRPLEFGADIVVYSATKHIDGQGRVLGGAVLGTSEFCHDLLQPFIRNTGPSMSPFNAWILLKGIETLELRVNAQSAAASKIADFLADLPGIENLVYPGRPDHPQYDLMKVQMDAPGSLICFDVIGGKIQAFEALKRLEVISISNNLGDSKSLITHPATTTHQRLGQEEREKLGISDSMVRLSVGLEDPEDLCEDLERALKTS